MPLNRALSALRSLSGTEASQLALARPTDRKSKRANSEKAKERRDE